MIREKIEELILHAKVEGKASPRSDGRGDNLVFTPCGKALVAAILQAIRDELPEKKDVSEKNCNDLVYRPPLKDGDSFTQIVINYDYREGFNDCLDQIKEKLK